MRALPSLLLAGCTYLTLWGLCHAPADTTLFRALVLPLACLFFGALGRAFYLACGPRRAAQ